MLRGLLLLLALTTAIAVKADSWAPPLQTNYVSASKGVRLTVIPRELKDQLSYFHDKVKGREPAGQAPTETKRSASGILERHVQGRWTQVWAAPLANEVAPVSALVADDGANVVTFDDWHMVGLGDNAVTIYGPTGALVRSLKISDILPKEYIDALPRSVSSLHWHADNHFSSDGKHVLLAVTIPSDDRDSSKPAGTIDVAVDLATGAVVPPSGAEWESALAAAKRVQAAHLAADEARKAAFVAPLVAPATNDERLWHAYLSEAFLRTDPDWKRRSTSTTVIPAPSSPYYARSEGWVRDELRKEWEDDVMSFASPTDPKRLVAMIEKVARTFKPGVLASARVYFAGGREDADAVRSSLAKSGAEVIWIDVTKPIPQRPERLHGETPFDDLLNED